MWGRAGLVQRWLRAVSCIRTPVVPPLAGTLHGCQNSPFAPCSSRWVVTPVVGLTEQLPSSARRRGRRRIENRVPDAAVQAHLAEFGIDVPKVVQRYPPVASYNVERVQKVTAFLVKLGVDVKHVVEQFSVVLSGKVEAYEAVVKLLRDNGINVAKAVTSFPGVLGRRIPTLQTIMDAISHSGSSVADIINKDPIILRFSALDTSVILDLSASNASPRQMHPKAALFFSLGVDANLLLKRMPRVLTLSMDKLQAAVDYLKALHVDVPVVVHRAPSVLGFRLESLQQRVHFLLENGLDVVRQVNGCPEVLYYNIDKKLRPILTFVVQEMGRSLPELNVAYN
eukprot:EG_transcript_17905